MTNKMIEDKSKNVKNVSVRIAFAWAIDGMSKARKKPARIPGVHAPVSLYDNRITRRQQAVERRI